MKKNVLILIPILLLALLGCKPVLYMTDQPLVVSKQPDAPVRLPVTVGLVKLKRPLKLSTVFYESFPAELAATLENGMLTACRIVDPGARLYDSPKDADVDILLVPTNPYFEVGHSTYDVQVVISLELMVHQKGDSTTRGILVEVTGDPEGRRPLEEVELFGIKYGLIGGIAPGSKLERALNYGLFNFSVEFLRKLTFRAHKYHEQFQVLQ